MTKNSCYLITGASSDIGIELCRTLAPNARRIIATCYSGNDIFYRLQDELYIVNPDLDFTIKNIDLSDIAMSEEFAKDITGENITHLVHLPSLRPVNKKLKNFDFERFYCDFELQVGSALRLSAAVLPNMSKAKFGRIVFMLSSYINTPPKNMTAYITVKSALAGLCKSLSVDFAAFGITVNAVLPSMIETKFLQDISSLIVEAAAYEHPLRRNATVFDIIPAINFLLSEEAGYITGIMLPITGGL